VIVPAGNMLMHSLLYCLQRVVVKANIQQPIRCRSQPIVLQL
jgi:hypothetical protein